jgi:phage-related protein
VAVVVGEAAVRLRPQTKDFAREAESDIDRDMPGIAGKAAGFFAAAFAAVGVGAFLGNAISEAVDLGESASKVGVVFGDAAGQVEDFAATASSSLGLSEAAALGATGTFGNLLRATGLAEQAAADMSVGAVKLAGDLASFNNASPEEALDALRAGLVGEAEPLKRFGVNLNAAAIEAKAVELGLAAVGEELTDSAKASAAYAVIMEQTALAQGDFARTSEGLANQQRIAKAQFLDLSADIGGLFVPMLGNAAAGLTGGLMPALLRATDGLPAFGDALGRVGDLFRVGFSEGAAGVNAATEGVEGAGFAVLQFAGYLGDLASIAVRVFSGADASGQFAAGTFEHLAATVGWVVATVRDALGPAFAAIGAAVGPALAQVGDAFGAAFGGGGGGGFIEGFVGILQTAAPLIAEYVGRWAEVFAAVIPIIADVLSALAPIIADLVAQIGPVLSALVPVISQVAGVIAETLLAVLTALAPVLPPLVAAIGQVASVLAGAFLAVLQAIAPILPQLVEAIASVAVALAGALAGALAAILPVLPPLIDALLQLVLAALTPLLPILPMIAELIGGLIGALAPILPLVAEVVAMLIDLALQALAPILPLLPMLAGLFGTIIGALAPFIPLIVQIVALLIQLAIQAIVPLMPFISTLMGMWASLIQTFMPIVGLLLNLAGVFISFGANVLGAVVGFVSSIVSSIGGLIGWFVGLPGRILSAIGNFGSLLFNKGLELIQGLVNGIASAASFVGNVVRNVVNAIIDFINRNVIDGINDLLEFTVAGITINPPDIPRIPRLHSGGVFDSGEGEGLALLRDQERVATPEQREIADNLLAGLLAGELPAVAASGAAAGGVEVNNYITQLPGEDGGTLAARVTQGTVWRLNLGVTRTVGAPGGAPA